MSIPFWINQPTILFNKKYLTDLFPSKNMTLEEKFNAITKFVLVLTVLGFIFSQNLQIIFIGILTIAIVTAIYYRKRKQYIEERTQENFTNNKEQENENIQLKEILKDGYHPNNKKNPFGNVLLTDINSNPDRPSAAPSFNPEVYNKINNAVKKQTQMLNPTIDETNKQIYGDLYENYNLDKSLMRMYTTANTRVANDQGAFSQWLYGNMPSSKEDNIEGNIQRVKNNVRYNLY
jgi:predicted GTPase